jgi:hypothetical protein
MNLRRVILQARTTHPGWSTVGRGQRLRTRSGENFSDFRCVAHLSSGGDTLPDAPPFTWAGSRIPAADTHRNRPRRRASLVLLRILLLALAIGLMQRRQSPQGNIGARTLGERAQSSAPTTGSSR